MGPESKHKVFLVKSKSTRASVPSAELTEPSLCSLQKYVIDGHQKSNSCLHIADLKTELLLFRCQICKCCLLNTNSFRMPPFILLLE